MNLITEEGVIYDVDDVKRVKPESGKYPACLVFKDGTFANLTQGDYEAIKASMMKP